MKMLNYFILTINILLPQYIVLSINIMFWLIIFKNNIFFFIICIYKITYSSIEFSTVFRMLNNPIMFFRDRFKNRNRQFVISWSTMSGFNVFSS